MPFLARSRLLYRVATAPIKPDAPLPARRLFAWLSGAGLAVVLLFAMQTRLTLPMLPAADWDVWGYLRPALTQLTGREFLHTYGRNFVYPGWVWLWLKCTGDFRAIGCAQHVLGLASGVLLWVCWRQWRGWFADPRLPAWADAAIGLGLVAFFEQSTNVIVYEHLIRPESIFPFFGLVELYLLMGFLRAWHVARRPGQAAALAAGGLFTALLLYQLKPSFGLAVAVSASPVLAAALVPWRQPGRGRWLLAGAAGAAALAGAVLFAWPEHRLSQADPMSGLFLPETLLTIHADMICSQMEEDVRARAVTPYPVDWLARAQARLAAELHEATTDTRLTVYKTLGFNPDYLMETDDRKSHVGRNRRFLGFDPDHQTRIEDSFCAWLHARLSPPQVAAFAFYYYRRVWMHRPGQMLAKVCRQLGAFYSWYCPAFGSLPQLDLARSYRRGIVALDYANYQSQLALYPPAREFLDATGRLGHSRLLYPQWELEVEANAAAAASALPLLLLFLAGLGVAGLARAGTFHAPDLAGLLAPGWVLLLFQGLIFGNCLTVAIVHSLDVGRYSSNLLVFCALAMAATIAWLLEFILALCDRRPVRPRPSAAPPTAAASSSGA